MGSGFGCRGEKNLIERKSLSCQVVAARVICSDQEAGQGDLLAGGGGGEGIRPAGSV